MAPALVETPAELYSREANSYASKVSHYLDNVTKAKLPPTQNDASIP